MAIAMAESGGGEYSREGEFMPDEAYIQYLIDSGSDYAFNERGAGYIQVTYREAHLDFLATMGDDFDGPNTAEYIAENYPLESAVWYWTRDGYYDGGTNEFRLFG